MRREGPITRRCRETRAEMALVTDERRGKKDGAVLRKRGR